MQKYVLARNCANNECEHLAYVTDEEGNPPLEFKTKREAKEAKDMLIQKELLSIVENATMELNDEIMIMPKEEN